MLSRELDGCLAAGNACHASQPWFIASPIHSRKMIYVRERLSGTASGLYLTFSSAEASLAALWETSRRDRPIDDPQILDARGRPRCLRLCQVRVLGEERDFVAVGYRHVAFTSFALKVMGCHEPATLFD
jgi:hypothetical protein